MTTETGMPRSWRISSASVFTPNSTRALTVASFMGTPPFTPIVLRCYAICKTFIKEEHTMKHRSKRLLSILLSLVMVLGLMPGMSLTAYAAQTIDGTNLTWEISDTGTLTISGTGEIPDYGNTYAPWRGYQDSIKSIVINDGVTRIGISAFDKNMKHCNENLTQVTIPSSVTSVGESAFASCSGITNVSLGSSVIGKEMFQGCSGLTQITIPSNVTDIGMSAFSGCSNLATVTFTPAETGKTLKIGNYSFLMTNAKVAYGTGNTRLYDGDTEIQANTSLSNYQNKTLTWKAPVTEYPLWVGGTQVTSANADDVFGDGKVKYTPAKDSTPATLTLNG
ncbi:MAG: leucine-rich repeat domain-containing protein, partial [Clostridia bacterium]|nr:leucine-rich repeat domain-containing protein [Clostridia bacterium]